MAHRPIKPDAQGSQSQFAEMSWEEKANLAFACHKALMKMRAAAPHLAENPYFDQLILDSFQRFNDAFGRVS